MWRCTHCITELKEQSPDGLGCKCRKKLAPVHSSTGYSIGFEFLNLPTSERIAESRKAIRKHFFINDEQLESVFKYCTKVWETAAKGVDFITNQLREKASKAESNLLALSEDKDFYLMACLDVRIKNQGFADASNLLVEFNKERSEVLGTKKEKLYILKIADGFNYFYTTHIVEKWEGDFFENGEFKRVFNNLSKNPTFIKNIKYKVMEDFNNG